MLSKSKAIKLAVWELQQKGYYPANTDLRDIVESEGLWEPWAANPSGMIRQMVNDKSLLLSRYNVDEETRDVLGPKLYDKAVKLCATVESNPHSNVRDNYRKYMERRKLRNRRMEESVNEIS